MEKMALNEVESATKGKNLIDNYNYFSLSLLYCEIAEALGCFLQLI
jgi:hypothetical protein